MYQRDESGINFLGGTIYVDIIVIFVPIFRPGENMTTQKVLKNSWQKVVTEFYNKSDRAAAVLGAAFLEAHLGQLISSFFVKGCEKNLSLLDFEGPLGTFFARVRAAA